MYRIAVKTVHIQFKQTFYKIFDERSHNHVNIQAFKFFDERLSHFTHQNKYEWWIF